jgi:hypothetical protein
VVTPPGRPPLPGLEQEPGPLPMPGLGRRALRLLAICLALVAAWYGLSYKRDWLYFYARQETVVRSLPELGAALARTGINLQTLGQVSYGNSNLPLWVLRKPAFNPAAKTICLMAGMHGNEPAGVQTLLALLQDMAARPATFAAHRYVVVPLANPWGWARDLRHNGDNRDTARQFVSGGAQEARLLKNLFTAERCDLLVDLHEDRFHNGFYLLAYGEPNMAGVENTLKTIETTTGVSRASRGNHGVLAFQTAEFDGILLTTAPLWARMQGAAHAFVVETHDALPLAQRVAIHRLAIEGLSRLLTPETGGQ